MRQQEKAEQMADDLLASLVSAETPQVQDEKELMRAATTEPESIADPRDDQGGNS